jgi:hypothetical protein
VSAVSGLEFQLRHRLFCIGSFTVLSLSPDEFEITFQQSVYTTCYVPFMIISPISFDAAVEILSLKDVNVSELFLLLSEHIVKTQTNSLHKFLYTEIICIGPASWSSVQNFRLLTIRSRVRLPILPWGIYLERKIPMVDHGLGSLVVRPILVLHIHVSPST